MNTVDVDAELAPLAELAELIPVMDAETIHAVRGQRFGPEVELSSAVERSDHVAATHDDGTELVVRVHRPAGVDGPLPCFFSIHGGGYVVGSMDMDDHKFDQWCPAFQMVGVSVEYRLAPETPYPGPLEDCYAGLAWTFANADEIGVDPTRIGIGGVSAGGGLAAGLALLVRDRGEFEIQFQLLDCPMIDDRMQTPSSQLDDLWIWSKQSNLFGWQSYLGDLHGSDDVPAHAAAARAVDLSGLPPAYISVGGADGFRDEDITYAMRLNGADVPCELHVYPGAPHGIGMFAGTRLADRYNADQTDWVARQIDGMAT